ncbi:hypothetical protein MUO32_26215 [Shinella sp. CPCC 101442]|uniref:hypothetical protein n=1 Tax=Shinella sp. CPCC 101442 TaxID=2932265 RepID=UPI0021531EC7|nr:hypothetical protein [Shinella sp. CPCC 101442]MCR6502527.1 hypothetical protein [Shinella sp. CPCC 101442]
MPKQKHYGPYLIKRNARYDASGRLTHRGTFIIADGEARHSTGCGFGNPEEAQVAAAEAELKLHEYKTAKYAHQAGQGLVNVEAEFVKIGELIVYYLLEHEEKIGKMTKPRRREFLSQVERLTAFWGEKMVSEINRKNSTKYQEGKSVSVVRNELILLRSMINFAASEGKLKKYDKQLNFVVPRLQPRMHYFDVDEVIAMYKGAMRTRHTWHGKKTYRMASHIAKFILVAVLTGSRANRIIQASFVLEKGRPWIDLKSGIFYRRPEGEFVPDNKQADPVKIPKRLLALMKIWHHGIGKTRGTKYLCEYQGRPADCRKGFWTLKNKVLSEERAALVNRHSLRHTSATILLQGGVSVDDVGVYLSAEPEMIKKVYSHVIPGEYSPVHRVLDAKQPRRPRPGAKPELKVVGGTGAHG